MLGVAAGYVAPRTMRVVVPYSPLSGANARSLSRTTSLLSRHLIRTERPRAIAYLESSHVIMDNAKLVRGELGGGRGCGRWEYMGAIFRGERF